MKNALLLLFLFLPACGDANATATDESAVTGRRVRLERLASVDALARLYVGHELPRRELVGLEPKSEVGVVDALVSRPDFRTRYAARIAEFESANGDPPKSRNVDPDKPIVDALGTKTANRFARWVVETQAPIVATELIAKHEKTLGKMTYRELLDTIRKTSANRRRQ